ncbi:DMT family transporter [Dongia soli]|uniref:DMT family transporter n=1 Tax=Dongia soli TaxID=600628 RepID=A0ABU5EA83_9PROT|nr:DMT family transporter [Dongia soli]MDY0882699.1 DMT family transporter [Dongia soli]
MIDPNSAAIHRQGSLLVAAAALCWSTGGLIARFITADSWTQVCWRGGFSAAALLIFLLWREGRNIGTVIRTQGLPGLAVALCFSAASICFIIALRHTTVATILVIQSTAPLIAGIIAWLWMRETISVVKAMAMLLALGGVSVMVSRHDMAADPSGLLLSAVIAFSLAIATVITRRFQHIRMTPACCLSGVIMAVVGAVLGAPLETDSANIALLFLFGAGQLAVGLICFSFGARLIPASEAALIGLLECILGPVWVFLFLGENPGIHAVIGGLMVLGAVAWNTIAESRRVQRVVPKPVN